MALLFCDGFDHYTTILQKWDSIFTLSPTISGTGARSGTQGAVIIQNTGMQKNLGKNVTTGICGFAVNFGTMGPVSAIPIVQFFDAGTIQVDFRVNSSGQIFATRNGVTTLGTATTAMPTGWHYLEFKVTINGATGIAEVRLDGVPILTLSGQNTQQSANAFYNAIRVGWLTNVNAFTTMYMDDLVMTDNSGALNTNYLGDIEVFGILPNANGTENDFAMGGTIISAQNFGQVDEVPPDDDTTYVYSPTVGQIDRYLYPAAIPTTGTPFAVVVWNRARKDDVGNRSIRADVKSGATVADNGADLPLSSGYQYFMGLFETDPNTGIAWTLPNIQAAEFGVKVSQ